MSNVVPHAHSRRSRVLRSALLVAIVVGAMASFTSAQGGLFVAISAPAPGSTVGGTVTVRADASATTVAVRFTLDGVTLGAEDTTAPYSIAWNTTTASNGPHTLRAVARDVLGLQWTSDPVTVTVFNDLTPPTVAITAPAAGSTASGTTAVTANASDNIGVAGVQFFVDGAVLGAEDTSAPYSAAWDTATAANGSHTLTARARDAAGNTTTSAAVTVTVANGAGSNDPHRGWQHRHHLPRARGTCGNTSRPWSGGTAAIGFGARTGRRRGLPRNGHHLDRVPGAVGGHRQRLRRRGLRRDGRRSTRRRGRAGPGVHGQRPPARYRTRSRSR